MRSGTRRSGIRESTKCERMTVTRTRINLALAIMCVTGLGVYWAYGAQHGQPLWAPPQVLPDNDGGPLVIPGPTRVEQKKAAAKGAESGVIPAGGVLPAPPPMFP